MKFEYVASGVSYSRIGKKNMTHYPETLQYMQRCIQSCQDKHSHTISFLYNGYTEKALGEQIHNWLRPCLDNIYSDSGGLQMVTLGHKANDKLRKEVYKSQMAHSDVAMSFDEIPLVMKGEKSSVADRTGRLFDASILEERARQSGQNLKEQIEYFGDSDTKVMMIVQGNDFDTAQAWVNYLLEEIPEDYYPYISGISLSGAALGSGQLEDFVRMFIMSKLQYPEKVNSKHLHLLGVGSIVRLIPLAALHYGGHFKDGYKISYDSTTHTAGLAKGNYCMEGKNVPLTKIAGRNFKKIVNNINMNMERMNLLPLQEDRVYKRLVHPSLWDKEFDRNEDSFKEFQVIYSYLTSQLYNFTESVEKLFTDSDTLATLAGQKKIYGPCMSFKTVRDKQDFDAWLVQNRRRLKSVPILRAGSESASLESLFA